MEEFDLIWEYMILFARYHAHDNKDVLKELETFHAKHTEEQERMKEIEGKIESLPFQKLMELMIQKTSDVVIDLMGDVFEMDGEEGLRNIKTKKSVPFLEEWR